MRSWTRRDWIWQAVALAIVAASIAVWDHVGLLPGVAVLLGLTLIVRYVDRATR